MSRKRHRILPSVMAVISIAILPLVLLPWQQQSLHADIKPLSSSNNSSSNHTLQEFLVPAGSHPHDFAPSADGRTIWYTAQALGQLGQLDPKTGKTHSIALGKGSAPSGVIIGPDGAPWITDGGLNAIVRVDPLTEKVRVYYLPAGSNHANLNTASFDHSGVLCLLDKTAFMVDLTQLWEGYKYSRRQVELDRMVLQQHQTVAFTTLH